MNECKAKNGRNIAYRSNQPTTPEIKAEVENMLGNWEVGHYKHLKIKTKDETEMTVYGS